MAPPTCHVTSTAHKNLACPRDDQTAGLGRHLSSTPPSNGRPGGPHPKLPAPLLFDPRPDASAEISLVDDARYLLGVEPAPPTNEHPLPRGPGPRALSQRKSGGLHVTPPSWLANCDLHIRIGKARTWQKGAPLPPLAHQRPPNAAMPRDRARWQHSRRFWTQRASGPPPTTPLWPPCRGPFLAGSAFSWRLQSCCHWRKRRWRHPRASLPRWRPLFWAPHGSRRRAPRDTARHRSGPGQALRASTPVVRAAASPPPPLTWPTRAGWGGEASIPRLAVSRFHT